MRCFHFQHNNFNITSQKNPHYTRIRWQFNKFMNFVECLPSALLVIVEVPFSALPATVRAPCLSVPIKDKTNPRPISIYQRRGVSSMYTGWVDPQQKSQNQLLLLARLVTSTHNWSQYLYNSQMGREDDLHATVTHTQTCTDWNLRKIKKKYTPANTQESHQ